MSSEKRPFLLGVDLGGADTPPHVLLSELSSALAHIPLCFYAPRAQISVDSVVSPLHQVVFSSQEICRDENPLLAVRRKRDSSLMRGIYDLNAHKIDAFLSLANTGALVLASSFVLGRLPNVHCPALIANLPSSSGEVAVLDLGASPQQTALRLQEVIVLGATYAKLRSGKERPRVGLLNIGHEEIKGTEALREVDSSLKAFPPISWDYVGFIEPIDIFKGTVDIAVTDGFTGNVLLKTAEGVYELLQSYKKSSKTLHKAGLLVGVCGDVYKGHGRARPDAIAKIITTLVDRHSSEGPFFEAFQRELQRNTFRT